MALERCLLSVLRLASLASLDGALPACGTGGCGECLPRLVINELIIDGPDGDIIELANLGDADISLSGMKLKPGQGGSQVLLDPDEIEKERKIVLAEKVYSQQDKFILNDVSIYHEKNPYNRAVIGRPPENILELF